MSDSTEVLTELESLRGLDPGTNGAGGEHTPGPPEPMTFLRVCQLLWAQRRFVLRAALRALILFTVVAFLIPKHYIATTRLMPPDYGSNLQMALALPALSQGGAASGASGGAGGSSIAALASQFLGLNSSGDLFIGVLQSQTVEDRIIRKFDLMNLYSTRYIEDARDRLEARTEIVSDRKSGIISISVDDKSPQRAAAMAKMYVDELNKALALVNTSAAGRERIFIENRLKEVKQELDTAAKELADFSSKNATIDVPEQAKAMVAAGADLQAQLIAAESELNGLRQIYTENNVRLRTMKANVDELRRQVEKFGGKDVDPSKDSVLAHGELYPSIRQLPLVGVKYLDLFRRAKIDEVVFEFLTKEYEIAKVEEAREIPSVQVLDPPIVPGKKSSPHRLVIMMAGLLLGLVGSSLLVVGNVLWHGLDATDERKVLMQEVFCTIKRCTWDTRFFQERCKSWHRVVSLLKRRVNEQVRPDLSS